MSGVRFTSPLPPSSPLSPLLSSSPASSSGQPQLHTPYTPYPQPDQTLIHLTTTYNALPPMSSDDIIRSPNIVGSAAERATIIREKAQVKRLLTIQTTRQSLFAAEAKRQQEDKETRKRDLEAAEKTKTTYFTSILNEISARGYTFGQLVTYVSDPDSKQGSSRWDGMLKDSTFISRVLGLWGNKGAQTTQDQVREWAVDFVVKEVWQEAQRITSSLFLQTRWRPTDSKLVLGFNISTIQTFFRKNGSIFMSILDAIATSSKQIKHMKPARLHKKAKVITSSALALLGEFSYSNNWAKKAMGLYLYSTGSQRQPLSVMSHLGISESYNTIAGKSEDTKQGGSLRQLSKSMLDTARAVASTGLFATSYDNINMVFRAAEQIVGRTDAIENGTCSTIWPLFKALNQDMHVQDLEESFDKAPPLSIPDILLNATESASLEANLIHCALRIIVMFGGEPFRKFEGDIKRTLPQTPHKIELHQTPLHPLPAFDIDESTIVGGAEVVDAIFEVLNVKKVSEWTKTVKFFCGDQLTIARLRSLVNIRAGHEGGYPGFGWGVWMPGLFHAKMADIHGVFMTHWGKPSSGPRNPGCLAFHNTVLQRKPILLTSLPPFRACRDLIFISLYGRILHCLLLVSKKCSLEEYAEDMTWEILMDHATTIVQEYASADRVAALRWKRKYADSVPDLDSLPGLPRLPSYDGDMVFENAVLFLRDALLSREFTDAVKAGDSGRVVLVLKMWALSFRGSGRTKYAHEMLHLIHNITHIWPKAIRDIVFNNWLINTTGNPNSWLEVDLMQEHMNFWIKNFYRAHGSAASWAWLEMIAPCVNVLRDLGRSFKEMLGTDLGTAHHPMDLSVDLPDLMQSLEDHEVYIFKNGRHLDEDDPPVTDIITSGLNDLLSGKTSPLNDYNTAFQRLQARRRLPPLVNKSVLSPLSQTPMATGTATLPAVSQMTDVLDLNTEASDEDDFDNEDALDSEDQEDNQEDNDLDGGLDDEIDDNEDIGDFLRSFEDTLGEEGSLGLVTAADVSLDMDAEDLGLEQSDDEVDSDVEDSENADYFDTDLDEL